MVDRVDVEPQLPRGAEPRPAHRAALPRGRRQRGVLRGGVRPQLRGQAEGLDQSEVSTAVI